MLPMRAAFVVGIVAGLASISGYAEEAAPTKPADAKAAPPVLGASENPASIPSLPEKIKIDGDPAKWKAIPALPAPFSKQKAGVLKLAWREDGLYGCAQIKCADLVVDETSPWQNDCLELWLDISNNHGETMDDAVQLALAPNPTIKGGTCIKVMPQGSWRLDVLEAAWSRTDTGYVLEFYIPVKAFNGKLSEGAKIGFNYSVDEDGKAIEQYFSDKDTDGGYTTPARWGAIQLKK